MDATVNDFLNEINEIVPPVKKTECVWQECFDDNTGFPYYWNVKTNEVTWEMPLEYKNWLKAPKTATTNKSSIQTKPEPLFPGVALTKAPENIKIYKIQEETQKVSSISTNTNSQSSNKIKLSKDDEKVTLISYYEGDSESENEENLRNSRSNSPAKSIKSANSLRNSDEEDNKNENNDVSILTKDKPTLGFSLLAGYGDDSEEEDDDEVVQPQQSRESSPKIVHSTLFPATKPIDVNQFIDNNKESERLESKEDIDTKPFQRKRRLDVNLINVSRTTKNDENVDEELEHKGFGFKSNFTNMKSGGGSIAFIKAETLNPTIDNDNDDKEQLESTKGTLKEKLFFLSEGRDSASPVQVMLIQLETLHAALKSGDLTNKYFSQWIKEMCEQLIKLEEEAAPSGWNLAWCRSQKRYFYRNKSTDDCQWEYPQSVDDDAMDICTTPPPHEEDLSSARNTPTPPPPPKLDKDELLNSVKEDKSDQMCGIDSKDNSNLNLALDSFYSDIAAMESSIATSADSNNLKEEKKTLPIENTSNGEPSVKKKKKVKMGQGISMKKKGVGQLVEKWKNVQKNLD